MPCRFSCLYWVQNAKLAYLFMNSTPNKSIAYAGSECNSITSGLQLQKCTYYFLRKIIRIINLDKVKACAMLPDTYIINM